MKTAVIYARFSCERQTEQSIEGQVHVCQEYAARNDIIIVDTYMTKRLKSTINIKKQKVLTIKVRAFSFIRIFRFIIKQGLLRTILSKRPILKIKKSKFFTISKTAKSSVII